MTRIVNVFAVATALMTGAGQAGASPLITLSNLQFGEEPELESTESVTTPAALTLPADGVGLVGEENAGRALDAGPAGRTLDLMADDASTLAFPVTGSISVGVAYELEDAEDLAQTLIDGGMVEDDHLNHSLVFKARWHFGEGG